MTHRVDYVPAEGNTGLFGGNSNWRGPVWFPINYLLLEALERYHHFYGDEPQGRVPGRLGPAAHPPAGGAGAPGSGSRGALPAGRDRDAGPATATTPRYATDPHWKDLVLFHEYFHGDNGRGVGASHQTGWTALVLRCIEDVRAGAGATGAAPTARPAGGWRRAGDERAHRDRRPHRVAGGRRPGRLRLGHDRRAADPPLPCAAAGRHDAADRPDGARERAGRVGGARGAGGPSRAGVPDPPAVRAGRGGAGARRRAGSRSATSRGPPGPTGWRTAPGSSTSCSCRAGMPAVALRWRAGGPARGRYGSAVRPAPLGARLARAAPRESGVPVRGRRAAGERIAWRRRTTACRASSR